MGLMKQLPTVNKRNRSIVPCGISNSHHCMDNFKSTNSSQTFVVSLSLLYCYRYLAYLCTIRLRGTFQDPDEIFVHIEEEHNQYDSITTRFLWKIFPMKVICIFLSFCILFHTSRNQKIIKRVMNFKSKLNICNMLNIGPPILTGNLVNLVNSYSYLLLLVFHLQL